MKKMISMLCALLLICSAAAASADLYKANTPEIFRELAAGKSFFASITGLEYTGEDEDTKFTIRVTVCERDRFDAEVVENLKAQDILVFGNGTATMISGVTRDEFGTVADGFQNDAYSFYRTEEGDYIAVNETEYPFWTEVFTIKVPLEKDIRFLDWSDPENLEAPVQRGFDELLDQLLEEANFSPYNTQVTFDENGKLTELLYTYSPWN